MEYFIKYRRSEITPDNFLYNISFFINPTVNFNVATDSDNSLSIIYYNYLSSDFLL